MRQKILVIDDSMPIHMLVRARLTDEPVDMISAYDGESGLAAANEQLPDAILLDVDMPYPDGFEVCRRLKAEPRTNIIPVVFLTGASSTEEKIRGLNLGAVDYITKPFDPAELRARVRASLRTKYLMDLLAKRAQIDGLTGLFNRAFFEHRLLAEMAQSRRSGRPLACIMADVDHFKAINDRFGHPVGDEVLRAVANLFLEQCRTEDIICRYGGEEFVILTPGVDVDGALQLAERLRAGVEKLQIIQRDQPIPVRCSFGVAAAPTPAPISLVDLADRALYQAKNTGRNRVQHHVAPESILKAG